MATEDDDFLDRHFSDGALSCDLGSALIVLIVYLQRMKLGRATWAKEPVPMVRATFVRRSTYTDPPSFSF